MFSFDLFKPRGHYKYKELRIKPCEKLIKSALSQITFRKENIDYKPVDFNGETIFITGQLLKIIKNNDFVLCKQNK